MSQPESETRFAVLLFTDIVGSTDLKARYGVPAYRAALAVHNGHFERIARECHGIRILQNMGDGYFAETAGVAEAVRFALLFQDAMRAGPWGEICLSTRVGVHAGEVASHPAEGGSGIVAPAADLAARVMSLAIGGQILITRVPFDEARHFLREHPTTAGRKTPSLRWLAHGPYLLKGRDEPMEIFEVGAVGLAPLTPPPDGEKARRAIRPGEEETLGWRPAIGLEIPGRPGWRLTAQLGAGGFGEVWTGEQPKLQRRRAFKFCFDDERLRALKREVTLVRLLRTALGDRDDIVRFHELKLDAPPFYLESDLAPHGNILQWAEKQGGLAAIPLTQRIELVAHTATALAAAHSVGVLHKDIKPTNILIFDAPDGSVRPRLVDFGIGILADPTALGRHDVTAAGFTRATQQGAGTSTYSPPEYLAGKPYTVQGDIYGLGVLLYQLVTADASRPIAPGWERDVADALLREDITACVDGDPVRRLSSAADLADRLFHLDQRRGEIAEAERIAREAAARAEAEAVARAARIRAARLRKLAAAFAMLAVLAVAGGLMAWVNQRKADRRTTEYRSMLMEAARSDRVVAEQRLQLGQEREAFAHLARAGEYDRLSTLAAEKAVAALGLWNHVLPAAILAGHEQWVVSAQFSPDGVRVVTASYDNTARVWDAATGETRATLAGHKRWVLTAQFSPDGRRIATTSDDETARLWDAATGKALATLAAHKGAILGAQFSPNGSTLVTASDDKTARVWDAVTGNTLATLSGHTGAVRTAQFSPDGTFIVTASDDHTARVWNVATGQTLATLAEHKDAVRTAQFSPDGAQIVTASDDQTARVWKTSTGKSLATLVGHGKAIRKAQFNLDGTRIITASDDLTARIWDAATGRPQATLAGLDGTARIAEFSPDGLRIVTASDDLTARVWDAGTGKLVSILAGHESGVLSAHFSPDSSRLVTASDDRTARIWDLSPGQTRTTLVGHKGALRTAQFSPDGASIVTSSADKTARVWDAMTGKPLATLAGHAGEVSSAQFSPDGLRIMTASSDDTARLWDAVTGRLLATMAKTQSNPGVMRGGFITARRVDETTGKVLDRTVGDEIRDLSARFNPAGTRIVTAAGGLTARIWNATNGEPLTVLAGHKARVTSAGFSPDGTRVVTVSDDQTARLWDVNTGGTLATLAGHKSWVLTAQFSPDGRRIVTASFEPIARVWDANTGRMLLTLNGHTKQVVGAQFSPDGTRIVTASYDNTARIWDVATGKTLTTLAGHDQRVISARFSPEGTRIVTAAADKTARVWDAAAGKLVARLVGHEQAVWHAEFSPDGTRIVTVSEDQTARVWEVLSPRTGAPPEWFPDFLRYLAQMRLNSDGELEMIKAADWLVLRERLRVVLRARAGTNTPFLGILRRYVPE